MLALSCVTQKDRGKEGAHGGGIFVKPGVWPCGVGAKSMAGKEGAYFLRCPVEKALRRTDGIQWRQEKPPPPAPAMGCLVLTQPLFSVLGSAGDRPGCPPPPPSPHFIPGIAGWFVGLPLLCLWPRSHAEFFCTSEEEQSPGRSRLGGELRGPSLREPGCQGGASRTGLSKEAGSVAASLASSSGISCGCEQVAV